MPLSSICFHIGIAMSLRIEMFSYITPLNFIVFLPELFWNKLIFGPLSTIPRFGSANVKLFCRHRDTKQEIVLRVVKEFFLLPQVELVCLDREGGVSSSDEEAAEAGEFMDTGGERKWYDCYYVYIYSTSFNLLLLIFRNLFILFICFAAIL